MSINTEEIMRAACVMREAAEKMSQAIGSLDWTLNQHRNFMDDWLQRFQAALEAVQPK